MPELNENAKVLRLTSDIPALNGIRALAVLMVLVSHSGFGDIIPGGFGVTVFFFLSGYLITTLLLVEFGAKDTIEVKKFYIRRFLRLTPPLMVTLVVTYLAVLFGVSDGGITLFGLLSQIFYFANYFSIFFEQTDSLPAGTGVLWSLAVEEHFYFLYPIILLSFLGLSKRSVAAYAMTLLCLVVLMWRFGIALEPGFSETRIYYATDTRIDSILFGCILALTRNPMQSSDSQNILQKKHWMILFASIAVLAVTFVYRDLIFRQTLRYTLQGIALMPLFYLAISRHQHWFFLSLSNPLLQRIGIYSYSMYLIHFFIIHLLQKHFSLDMKSLSLVGAAALLSVIYAAIVHQFIERPIYKIRKKYYK